MGNMKAGMRRTTWMDDLKRWTTGTLTEVHSYAVMYHDNTSQQLSYSQGYDKEELIYTKNIIYFDYDKQMFDFKRYTQIG